MDADDQRESTRLVRMYSWEVDQRIPVSSSAYPLAQALVSQRESLDRAATRWRALLAPTDLSANTNDAIDSIVASESEKLRQLWQNYQQVAPAGERIDVNNTDPTLEGMTKIVKQGLSSWDRKRRESWGGKVMSKFHSFCRAVNSHKTLLDVLPQSSEYVSVFYGSLTAITLASVTHELIVQDFLDALCDMSRHIEDCVVDIDLYQTDDMKQKVAELYAEIFSVLGDISKWIMAKKRKRFTSAFNESLRDEFQAKIDSINARSLQVKNLAAQKGRVDVRLTRTIAEKSIVETQSLALTVEELRSHLQILGQGVIGLLQGRGETFRASRRIQDLDSQPSYDVFPAALSSSFLVLPPTHEHVPDTISNTDNLKLLVQTTTSKVGHGRLRLPAEGFAAMSIPSSAIIRLHDWVVSDSRPSSCLWLRGMHDDLTEDTSNPTTMLAAKFVELAEQIKLQNNKPLPCVSYFCRIRARRSDGTKPSPEAQGLVELLYALINQLAVILDASGTRLQNLPEENLDGTFQTWHQAMQVFSALLAAVTPGMLCVVDALHWLDGTEVENKLAELVRVLRKSSMMVLFTTSARCGALLREMSAEDVEMVEE